jgi:hypothetical protein
MNSVIRDPDNIPTPSTSTRARHASTRSACLAEICIDWIIDFCVKTAGRGTRDDYRWANARPQIPLLRPLRGDR